MPMPNLFDDATRARMKALYSARAPRSAAWYARQLAHALACIAEADRQHTPEELASALAALADGREERQASLVLDHVPG